ncbi:replication initiation factor domain-containing protein [Leuconostoc citreum]
MLETSSKLDFEKNIGSDLVHLRQKLAYTQIQMALFLNVSRTTYMTKIERSSEPLIKLLTAEQRDTLNILINADGVSLWLDYLSISFNMRSADWLVRQLCQTGYDLFIKRDGGRYGYNETYAYAGLSLITIFGKKDEPKSLITISGQGIRLLENLLMQQQRHMLDFLTDALAGGGKVTRIDFAFNDKSRFFNIKTLYDKIERQEFTQQFKSDPAFINNGHGGQTLYFGSRSGEVFFRFYEKDKEQATKRHVAHEEIGIKNRYEIELKQSRAQQFVQTLLVHGHAGNQLYGYLKHYVQFYDQSVSGLKKQEIAKLTPWSPWLIFLQTAQKVEYEPEPVNLSMSRSLSWFVTQVAPTLKALTMYYGQETIDEILDDTELSDRQKKLLSVAEKVNLPF